jgi:hypothetical protein
MLVLVLLLLLHFTSNVAPGPAAALLVLPCCRLLSSQPFTSTSCSAAGNAGHSGHAAADSLSVAQHTQTRQRILNQSAKRSDTNRGKPAAATQPSRNSSRHFSALSMLPLPRQYAEVATPACRQHLGTCLLHRETLAFEIERLFGSVPLDTSPCCHNGALLPHPYF